MAKAKKYLPDQEWSQEYLAAKCNTSNFAAEIFWCGYGKYVAFELEGNGRSYRSRVPQEAEPEETEHPEPPKGFHRKGKPLPKSWPSTLTQPEWLPDGCSSGLSSCLRKNGNPQPALWVSDNSAAHLNKGQVLAKVTQVREVLRTIQASLIHQNFSVLLGAD